VKTKQPVGSLLKRSSQPEYIRFVKRFFALAQKKKKEPFFSGGNLLEKRLVRRCGKIG
jgi:hypothetical protein